MPTKLSSLHCVFKLALVCVLLFNLVPAINAQVTTPNAPLTTQFTTNIQSLQQAATNNNVTILKNVKAEFARSIKANQPLFVGTGTAAQRGFSFIRQYASAFGKSTSVNNFAFLRGVENDELGMAHARYQQTINGVPVTGAYFHVHMKPNGVSAVSSSLVTDDAASFNTTANISQQMAASVATQLITQLYSTPVANIVVSTPRLEIFSTEVLGDVNAAKNHTLVWYIEARGSALRHAIWINAITGKVFRHFDKIMDARNRLTYDSSSTSQQRKPPVIRNEASANIGDADIDNAHNYIGDTYDYYFQMHGRDSYDDLGSDLISNVRFCPSVFDCPYANAFWDGDEMTYGEGFAIDDIVAHELTHGVVEFSADLIYAYQSGALNESYADIFGEAVDLTNGAGNDSAGVRWLIGEELGAARNMANPAQLGDPGKVSDNNYICSAVDNGGVHSNSGVPNHAFALMTDGGAYNGFTINGIGLSKAGKIQYRALTQYLGPSSTFIDNYNALNQSCTDLIGSNGISAADCAEVTKALEAVEMNSVPCYTPPDPIVTCPAGQESQPYFDDFESIMSGNWTNAVLLSRNAWNDNAGVPNIYNDDDPFSGSYSLHGEDEDNTSDSVVEMSTSIALPPRSYLTFTHKFNFETNYDGGVVEYSVNNGSTWLDAGSLILGGRDYVDTINDFPIGVNPNPLLGRESFTGFTSDYETTQLKLTSLSGANFRLRFRVGSDSSVGSGDGYTGWFIDDVEIYQCVEVENDCDFYSIKTQNNRVVTVCL